MVDCSQLSWTFVGQNMANFLNFQPNTLPKAFFLLLSEVDGKLILGQIWTIYTLEKALLVENQSVIST